MYKSLEKLIARVACEIIIRQISTIASGLIGVEATTLKYYFSNLKKIVRQQKCIGD